MLAGFQIFTDGRGVTKLSFHTQLGKTYGHNFFTFLLLLSPNDQLGPNLFPTSKSLFKSLFLSFPSVPKSCCSSLPTPTSLLLISLLHPIRSSARSSVSFWCLLAQQLSPSYKPVSSLLYSIIVPLKGRQIGAFGREDKNQGPLFSILILAEGSWSESFIGLVL